MLELLFILSVIGIIVVAAAISNFIKKRASAIYDKTIVELYMQGELKRPWNFDAVNDLSFAYWDILLFLRDDVAPVMGFDDVGTLVYRWDNIWEQQWLSVKEKVLRYSEQYPTTLKKIGFNNGLKNDVDFCSLLRKISELRHIDTPLEKHTLKCNKKTTEDFYVFALWRCLANGQPLPKYNKDKLTQDDAQKQLWYCQRKWGDKYYANVEAAAKEFNTYKGAFDFSFFLREIYTIKQPRWEYVACSEDGMLLYVENQSVKFASTNNTIEFVARADYTPMSKYETLSLQKFEKRYTSEWEKISYIIEICKIDRKEKILTIKEYTIFTYDGEIIDKNVHYQEKQQIQMNDEFSSSTKIYAYVINVLKNGSTPKLVEAIKTILE
ncbi:hypothetical protein R80B4_00861 [Fibrobacteres bacterium R8-0-B4]